MFDPFKGEFVSVTESLRERPELAARVGLCIGMWSFVELNLSILLSAMLHIDAQIGSTLFGVIKAESGRLAMLNAIAEDRLSEDLFAEYSLLQKRVNSLSGHRDKLAHGTWATSSAAPDILILADPRHISEHFATIMAVATGSKTASFGSEPPKFREDARCYGDAEFTYLEAEMRSLASDVILFASNVIRSR
jgi:hypothetical protein